MQEKDLQRKLNQELEEMAPDILQNILSKPIEPIKSEKELLGKDRALFQEKKSYKRVAWGATVAAAIVIALVIASVVTITNKALINPNPAEQQLAYSILIDVNPSIAIDVGSDGKVIKVNAGNDDAKEIVEKINKKITKDTTYEEVLSMAVEKLNKKKYFKKKDSAMLVSVVSDQEDNMKGKGKEVKEITNKIKEDNRIKCKTMYQKCVVTEELKSVADKNHVSVGKAALCVKIAKKENTSVKKLCKKKISSLVKKAEETGVISEEENLDEYVDVPMDETESQSETESIDFINETENTDFIDETEFNDELENESIDENILNELDPATEENDIIN